MAEVIMFPDLIEAMAPWLQTRISARGFAFPVTYRIPSPRPAAFVRLSVAGGTRLNIRQRETRLLVEAWAATEPAALRMAEVCSSEIEYLACWQQAALAPGVWISATPEDFSVPVAFTDPVSQGPRYQFYCNLILTGSAT